MEKSISIIKKLYEDYKTNEYAINKINSFIETIPSKIEEQILLKIKREERHEKLLDESEMFIHFFINNFQFYYIPITELFIDYNNTNYTCINEDNIWSLVLQHINKNNNIIPWKYKIKTNIMKRIKDNYLLNENNIPNTETIQQTLKLFMDIFGITKEKTKYILTIIGDNLLKKNTHLTYFIPLTCKKIFQWISDYTFFYLKYSRNPIDTFKYKYHYHELSNCRLINIPNSFQDYDYKHNIKNNIINIICVATHYSHRFINADHFINEICNNNELKNHSLYLKNNTLESIISNFKNEYLQEKNDSNTISLNFSDVNYLWKEFLNDKNIPILIYSTELIDKLNLPYNKYTKFFNNLISNKIGYVKHFNTFWNLYIEEDGNESDFEINELTTLYVKWLKDTNKNNTHFNIDENKIIAILNHFYSNIDIFDNKYLQGITCKLWNKKRDIQSFIKSQHFNYSISIHQLYHLYCQHNHNLNVNKQYFTNFLYEWISPCHIKQDIIETTLWNNIQDA